MHILDISIIIGYLILVIFFGFYLSKGSGKNLASYFLGGNKIKWYFLGLSNASGMFDISGVMWTVSLLFVYGLKSSWIPWLWPVWNQVFVMIFLALWIRRSNVMTGASWILTRFSGRGGLYSRNVIIIFAVISAIGFIAYFFEGIGKFCDSILPYDLAFQIGTFTVSSANSYALIVISLTALYTLKGGILSVVATEVFQYVVMTLSAIIIGFIAFNSVTHFEIISNVPEGWDQLFFKWKMDLDWSAILPQVNSKIQEDGFELIGPLFMMMLFKGFFSSLAGPVPGYDMQRILSTRTPREAAKMSAFTIIVLYAPRYLMIGAFAIIAISKFIPELQSNPSVDLEIILPEIISQFLPIGIKGLVLASLLAAFMGTFAAVVNAAPAYVVNDLLKQNLYRNKDEKTYVRLSYLVSILIIVIGITFGFFASSLNSITLWITASLFGGYTAANVLKWVWWRFNGSGYFWGMLFGLVASTVKLIFFSQLIDIYFFPIIFAFSIIGCLLGTWLYPADEETVLVNFYKTVKPWGFWKPIIKKIQAEDSTFIPNQNFRRDMMNSLIGIVWQMCFVVVPIYFLIKKWDSFFITVLILMTTTLLLKINWYNKLPRE